MLLLKTDQSAQPYLTMAASWTETDGTADQTVTDLSHKWAPLPKIFLRQTCDPEEQITSAETQHRAGDTTDISRH